MAADKFTRNKDYSNDADNNVGGRDSIDPAGLDGELDEVKDVTDDHADRLDILLRADLKMTDDVLQGHEFSAAALTLLASLIGTNSALVWRSAWANSTLYATGNLVSEVGVIYICLVEHTSPASGGFALGTEWEEFINPGTLGLPSQGGNANKVLVTNGTTTSWLLVGTANQSGLAPVADPAFTGVVGLPDVNVAGRFNLTAEVVAFVAGGNAFDFDTKFLKTVDVTGNYTGSCSVSNITQGDLMEVHFDNTSGSDAALLWDANWVWMGYAPATIPTGKKAVLSLRAPTGAAATDIIAVWSVEP